MPLINEFEFADSMWWDPVRVQEYVATPNPDNGKWYPLNPISVNIRRKVFSVGLKFDDASPRWRKGADLACYLYMNVSSVSPFPSVSRFFSRFLFINEREIITPPDMGRGTFPFMVQLKIPPWYPKIFVEVYEYSGPTNTQIEQDVLDIKYKVETL